MKTQLSIAIAFLVITMRLYGGPGEERRTSLELVQRDFDSLQEQALIRPVEMMDDYFLLLRRRVELGGFEEPRVQTIVNRIILGLRRSPEKVYKKLRAEIRYYIAEADGRHAMEHYKCWPFVEAATRLAQADSKSPTALEIFDSIPPGCRCKADLIPLIEMELFDNYRFDVLAGSNFAEDRLKRWTESVGALVSVGGADTGFAQRQRPKVAATVARKYIALLKLGRSEEAGKLADLAKNILGEQALEKAVREGADPKKK